MIAAIIRYVLWHAWNQEGGVHPPHIYINYLCIYIQGYIYLYIVHTIYTLLDLAPPPNKISGYANGRKALTTANEATLQQPMRSVQKLRSNSRPSLTSWAVKQPVKTSFNQLKAGGFNPAAQYLNPAKYWVNTGLNTNLT